MPRKINLADAFSRIDDTYRRSASLELPQPLGGRLVMDSIIGTPVVVVKG